MEQKRETDKDESVDIFEARNFIPGFFIEKNRTINYFKRI